MTTTTTRYTLLLDDGAVSNVERLRAAYNLRTKADVYDLAVRVLTWTTEQIVSEHEVGRYANGEFQPLLMPYAPRANVWRSGGNETARN